MLAREGRWDSQPRPLSRPKSSGGGAPTAARHQGEERGPGRPAASGPQPGPPSGHDPAAALGPRPRGCPRLGAAPAARAARWGIRRGNAASPHLQSSFFEAGAVGAALPQVPHGERRGKRCASPPGTRVGGDSLLSLYVWKGLRFSHSKAREDQILIPGRETL